MVEGLVEMVHGLDRVVVPGRHRQDASEEVFREFVVRRMLYLKEGVAPRLKPRCCGRCFQSELASLHGLSPGFRRLADGGVEVLAGERWLWWSIVDVRYFDVEAVDCRIEQTHWKKLWFMQVTCDLYDSKFLLHKQLFGHQ